jgi:integrase
VPERERWWIEQVERFVSTKTGCARWMRTMGHYLTGLGGNFPPAGLPCPSTPKDLTAAHILELKDAGFWSPTILRQALLVLRGFVEWADNPTANEPVLWETPGGAPARRRWLSAQQSPALWTAARGRQRLAEALDCFIGLHRIELLRLRVRDVNLAVARPEIYVLGKGKNGGKWRTTPLSTFAHSELAGACAAKGPNESLHPFHERRTDHDLRRAAQTARIGIHDSGHDLGRTFGRLAYEAGVGLVELNYLYGHAPLEMAAHCNGLDDQSARAGPAAFLAGMRALLPSPIGASG